MVCVTTSFIPIYLRQEGFKVLHAGVLPVSSSPCWDRASHKIRSTGFFLLQVTGLFSFSFYVMLRDSQLWKAKERDQQHPLRLGRFGAFWIFPCCVFAQEKQGSSVGNPREWVAAIPPNSPSAPKSFTSRIKAFLQHHRVLRGGHCDSASENWGQHSHYPWRSLLLGTLGCFIEAINSVCSF